MMILHNVASPTVGSAYVGCIFFCSILYYKRACLTVLVFIKIPEPRI